MNYWTIGNEAEVNNKKLKKNPLRPPLTLTRTLWASRFVPEDVTASRDSQSKRWLKRPSDSRDVSSETFGSDYTSAELFVLCAVSNHGASSWLMFLKSVPRCRISSGHRCELQPLDSAARLLFNSLMLFDVRRKRKKRQQKLLWIAWGPTNSSSFSLFSI